MRLVSTSEARLDAVLIAALSTLSDLRPSFLGSPTSLLREASSTFIIEGDLAVEDPGPVLSKAEGSTAYRVQSRGPPSGPAVVTAGAAELFGIELGVEKIITKGVRRVTIYALDY